MSPSLLMIGLSLLSLGVFLAGHAVLVPRLRAFGLGLLTGCAVVLVL